MFIKLGQNSNFWQAFLGPICTNLCLYPPLPSLMDVLAIIEISLFLWFVILMIFKLLIWIFESQAIFEIFEQNLKKNWQNGEMFRKLPFLSIGYTNIRYYERMNNKSLWLTLWCVTPIRNNNFKNGFHTLW